MRPIATVLVLFALSRASLAQLNNFDLAHLDWFTPVTSPHTTTPSRLTFPWFGPQTLAPVTASTAQHTIPWWATFQSTTSPPNWFTQSLMNPIPQQPTQNFPVANQQPSQNFPVNNQQPPQNFPVNNQQPPQNFPVANQQPPQNFPVNNQQPMQNFPVANQPPLVQETNPPVFTTTTTTTTTTPSPPPMIVTQTLSPSPPPTTPMPIAQPTQSPMTIPPSLTAPLFTQPPFTAPVVTNTQQQNTNTQPTGTFPTAPVIRSTILTTWPSPVPVATTTSPSLPTAPIIRVNQPQVPPWLNPLFTAPVRTRATTIPVLLPRVTMAQMPQMRVTAATTTSTKRKTTTKTTTRAPVKRPQQPAANDALRLNEGLFAHINDRIAETLAQVNKNSLTIKNPLRVKRGRRVFTQKTRDKDAKNKE